MKAVLRLAWKFLLALVLMCVPARADRALLWDSAVVEITAAEGDKEAEAVFAYTNSSNGPVEIRHISTSCGCTAAAADKKVVPPGESGSVRAKFVFGDRKGSQEKTIIVKTSEAEPSPYILTLRVEISGGVKLSEKSLTWLTGARPQPRYTDLTVPGPTRIKVSGIQTDSADFESSIEEIEPGTKYRISVKPTCTEKPMAGALLVNISEPKPRVIRIPLRIAP